jgi:general secretion pathway protein K
MNMPQSRHRPRPWRERGVAVVTALLLTTLAISIVASLFWQQQVQVRSMENQRLNLQTRWILRGALDYASLILDSRRYDNGGMQFTSQDQVWATPLAETRLDQYIERERVEGETFNATLSGNITDACSRYNLRNLAQDYRNPDEGQIEVFTRLLANLQLDTSLAKRIAGFVALSVPAQAVPDNTNNNNPGNNNPGSNTPGSNNQGSNTPGSNNQGDVSSNNSNSSTSKSIVASSGVVGTPIKLLQVDDLLAIPGVTPLIVERLRPFVIVLPATTPVNVNTAPAEVLAAVTNSSVSTANTLIVQRKQAAFRNDGLFTNALNVQTHGPLAPGSWAVKSDYFLVISRIRLDRAALDAEALVYSPVTTSNASGTQVKWVRQY